MCIRDRARAVLDHEGILEETRSIISQMSRDGTRKPAYSKKVPNNMRASVFKTPDNPRDVIRTSAGNLRDQIFQHLDAASRSDGGYEHHQIPQTTNSRHLSQQNSRMLKLSNGKGFFFPRRQRFNEDLN